MPHLILALLTVGAIGAAVLGLVLAPKTADLTVHNGAGETVLAPSVTALFSSDSPAERVRVVFTSPDRVTEILLGPNGKAVKSVSAQGNEALRALQPFQQIQKVTGWKASGSRFVASTPASSLVPAAEAPEVRGTITYSAAVSNGYLVDVLERYQVATPAGTEKGTDRYQVLRIAGQPVGS